MNKFKKLVIATRNTSKIEYYKNLLVDITDEVVGLEGFDITDKPIELGTTAEENAEIKAKFYSAKIGLTVFAEDEALYVDFLPNDKQPGTHVRRINGKDEVDDEKLLKHWESIISKVPLKKRTGKWHIAYSISLADGRIKTAGLDHLIMFFSPSSKIRFPGWPLSSLQGSILFKKPHSEQTPKEREISKTNTIGELRKILNELLY